MLFDTLHSLTVPQHVTLSDPYAPRTEKQIPFYKGFILVMRHGPYLTLTAAFLFITVAIQVNSRKNVFTKHFSDTVSSAEGGRPGIQALDVDSISRDEHLLKAGALKPVLALRTLGGDTSAATSGSLSHVAVLLRR